MWQPNVAPNIESALMGWQPDLTGTLVFVVQDQHVLLIEKKTGHGKGLLNGPGGKLDTGENADDCARRELQEELGVQVQQLTLMAKLRFIDVSGPQWLGYAYVGEQLTGVPTESPEARPIWYPIAALPLQRMWPDDEIWLPKILAGVHLHGDFLLDGTSLLSYRWRAAKNLYRS